MKGSEFKFLAMSMLLSGFSAGYIHAESHSEAVRMYVSQQESQCKGVVLDETGETVIGASVLVKVRLMVPSRVWMAVFYSKCEKRGCGGHFVCRLQGCGTHMERN